MPNRVCAKYSLVAWPDRTMVAELLKADFGVAVKGTSKKAFSQAPAARGCRAGFAGLTVADRSLPQGPVRLAQWSP